MAEKIELRSRLDVIHLTSQMWPSGSGNSLAYINPYPAWDPDRRAARAFAFADHVHPTASRLSADDADQHLVEVFASAIFLGVKLAEFVVVAHGVNGFRNPMLTAVRVAELLVLFGARPA